MKDSSFIILSMSTIIFILLFGILAIVKNGIDASKDLGYYKGKSEVYESYSVWVESKKQEEDKVLEALKNAK